MSVSRTSSETRERLLAAAALVFSEKGYRDATVREIVRRAGAANVAAVNYHFGDKEKLYGEVLHHAMRVAYQKYPPDQGLTPRSTPEEKLRVFVTSFLHRIFDVGIQAAFGNLMTREMVEPTAALDGLVEKALRPMYGRICAIVKELGPGLRIDGVERCAKSVVGQILFYKHCGPVIQRIEGGLPLGAAGIEALSAHITRFSLDGIRAAGRSRKRPSR